MGKGVDFLHGQGIHIGTQAYGPFASAILEYADDACASQATDDGYAPGFQLLRDNFRGAVFFKAKLRMGVDITPDLLNFGLELDDRVDQVHFLSPDCIASMRWQ
jgi:hypothetical protein